MEEALGPVWAFVVEKVAVALLLVVAGVTASFVVDRAKINWAHNAELAKLRVTEVSSVWAAATVFEAKADMLLRDAAQALQAEDPVRSLQALAPMQEESGDLAAQMKELAHEKRFFLGEKNYQDLLRFHNAVMDGIRAFGAGDLAALKRAERDIEARRRWLADFAKVPF